MAVASTTTPLDHTGDVGFRTWVAEFIAQLTAVGLTQTADTGQIDTATVTRPGVNANAGYAIFRFNDTLQATAPIFIRFDFGTDNGASEPRIQFLVGAGSNGSGTITGPLLAQRAMTVSVGAASAVTAYISRWVYNATLGFLGIAWKTGAQGVDGNQGVLFIGRLCDSSGATTANGVYSVAIGITNGATGTGGSGGLLAQQLHNLLTSTNWPVDASVSTLGGYFGVWPLSVTTTQVGVDTSVVPAFYAAPGLGLDLHLHFGGLLRSEVPVSNTFSLAVKGPTARTYISIGNPGSASTAMVWLFGATTGNGIFMLWE